MKKSRLLSLCILVFVAVLSLTAVGCRQKSDESDLEDNTGSYTIEFNAGRGGGKQMNAVSYKCGEAYELPINQFTVFGEEFMGWATEPDSYVVVYADKASVTDIAKKDETVTLYAVFDTVDSENFKIEGDYVVEYTGTARSIRLPNGATKVAPRAFYQNEYIHRVIVPDSYVQIGKGAFEECYYLTQLTVPFIGGSREKNRFMAYIFGASNYKDNTYEAKAMLTFNSYGDATSVRITQTFGVEVDGDYQKLQYFPSGLRAVIITGEQVDIPEGAFYYHYALERLVVDNSKLVTIGADAFNGAQALGTDQLLGQIFTPKFLNNVTYIGDRAFNAYFAEFDTEDKTVAGWEDYKGYGYYLGSLSDELELPSITEIGEEVFNGQTMISNVVFGENLDTIGRAAFFGLSEYTEVTLPASVRTIGELAFAYTGITRLQLKEGITRIGSRAFIAKHLAEVIIDGQVLPEIGKEAFGQEIVDIDNETTKVSFKERSFGIFAEASVIGDLKAELGAAYENVVKPKRVAPDEEYYFMHNGAIVAKISFTEGHAAIVDDPQRVFLLNFLGGENLGVYGTKYAVILHDAENVKLQMVIDDKGKASKYNSMADEDATLFHRPLDPNDDGHVPLPGKNYVWANLASESTFWNTMLCLDEGFYVDPDTGERGMIPMAVCSTSYEGRSLGFSWGGKVAKEGLFYINADRFYQVTSIQQYVKNGGGTLELVDIEKPVDTTQMRLEVLKDGGASETSIFKVLFMNNDRQILGERSFIIDILTSPIRFEVREYSEDAEPIDIVGMCESAIHLAANGTFKIDFFGLGTYTEIGGFFESTNDGKSFGENGYKVALTGMHNGLGDPYALTDGYITFLEFDRDGNCTLAKIEVKGEFTEVDLTTGDVYTFKDLVYYIVVVPGTTSDLIQYSDLEGTNKIRVGKNGEVYYMSHSESLDDSDVMCGFSKISGSGSSHVYTPLLDVEQINMGENDKGTIDYLVNFADLSDMGTGTAAFDANGCITITMDSVKTEYHTCPRGIYSTSDATINLDGNGNATVVKYASALDKKNDINGVTYQGKYEKIEDAQYFYNYEGAYYVFTSPQYTFISDDGELIWRFTIANGIGMGKIFSYIDESDLVGFTIYDAYGYKVGAMYQNMFGDFRYVEYTYDFDENGEVVYTAGDTEFTAAVIADTKSKMRFYIVVVDRYANVMFYCEIVDEENFVAVIDDAQRNYPKDRTPSVYPQLIPDESEITAVEKVIV